MPRWGGRTTDCFPELILVEDMVGLLIVFDEWIGCVVFGVALRYGTRVLFVTCCGDMIISGFGRLLWLVVVFLSSWWFVVWPSRSF